MEGSFAAIAIGIGIVCGILYLAIAVKFFIQIVTTYPSSKLARYKSKYKKIAFHILFWPLLTTFCLLWGIFGLYIYVFKKNF